MLQWVIFYQNERGSINYMTSENSERESMNYNSFLNFLNQKFVIKDFFDLKTEVDKFKVILLFESGEWQIHEKEKTDTSFYELYELNHDENKTNATNYEKRIEKSKNFIEGVFRRDRKW